MNPGLQKNLANARATLLAERNAAGHWEGELSTSALSTATAIIALHVTDAEKHRDLVRNGARWLIENQNDDGGWGDTTKSFSNISTTLLCWSALGLTAPDERLTLSRCEDWIRNYVGSLDPAAIAGKVKARYGKDRTFAVPILMTLAIGGRLGPDGWKQVLPLPFELAAFPRKWYAALQLPVVSYALPALIAIGYARFHHAPPWPPLRWLRRAIWPSVSRLLRKIQPASGGFLEAAPLTSFVSMALSSSGQKNHPVVENGVRFLVDSVRPDGSWPIDTNLATWVTTLAVKALGDDLPEDKDRIRDWLLNQQYRNIHPYTNAPPGGWAWTDLSGGVPDADDTPGALLALKILAPEATGAASAGIEWLLNLQNRDGGIPTFCRGWGALPFDRSSPDLTAHALRAWKAWEEKLPSKRLKTATQRALTYLEHQQAADGSWTPLWFGNQHVPDETNRTYGTAKVVLALSERPETSEMRRSGIDWLTNHQNADGGWGGQLGSPSSIEETSLAIDALAASPEANEHSNAIDKGVAYLIEHTQNGTHFPPSPIGFYFAKLWYYEKLYPLVWTVSALQRVVHLSLALPRKDVSIER